MHKPLRDGLERLGISSVEQVASISPRHSGHVYALLVNEIGRHKLLSVEIVEDWIYQAKNMK